MSMKQEKRVCSVEGCVKPFKARGFCASHWWRWNKYGSVELPTKEERGGTCTVEGCQRAAERGLGEASICNAHYFRRRNTGTFGEAPIGYRVSSRGGSLVPVRAGAICEVEGCEDKAAAYGYCGLHATRYRRHGDPGVFIPPESRDAPRGPRHRRWTGDDATYSAAHQRLRTKLGPASQYPCVDCGEGARHWSYNHAGAHERSSSMGPYTVDPSDYEPRCVTCHKRFDIKQGKEGAANEQVA